MSHDPPIEARIAAVNKHQTLDAQDLQPQTKAVRWGQVRSPEGEHAEAMYLTSSYIFSSAAEAAAIFAGEQSGNVYSRYTNPTVRMFEARLAALEQAEDCMATSSGMAAILSLGMTLLKQGDHLVCSQQVFGSTVGLFNNYFAKFGVEVSYVDGANLTAWQQAIQPNTRMFFFESPSNPLGEVLDLKGIAKLASQHEIVTVVDNCFCTPALQQPILHGIDVVIHSATKYIDGQGRCLGGVVAGKQDLVDQVRAFVRTAGPTMSPFNAWVFIKGLETLALRMTQHSNNAMAVAQFLSQHPQVSQVHYAGLKDNRFHKLALSQQSHFGAVLSFEVVPQAGQTRQEAAWQIVDRVRLFSVTANLGDTKSTITHPATTTHGRLTSELRQQMGIQDNLVRLAVGLEDARDLIQDLTLALNG